jgi:hypothetical protein
MNSQEDRFSEAILLAVQKLGCLYQNRAVKPLHYGL